MNALLKILIVNQDPEPRRQWFAPLGWLRASVDFWVGGLYCGDLAAAARNPWWTLLRLEGGSPHLSAPASQPMGQKLLSNKEAG